jgi:hypothetical protein
MNNKREFLNAKLRNGFVNPNQIKKKIVVTMKTANDRKPSQNIRDCKKSQVNLTKNDSGAKSQ